MKERHLGQRDHFQWTEQVGGDRQLGMLGYGWEILNKDTIRNAYILANSFSWWRILKAEIIGNGKKLFRIKTNSGRAIDFGPTGVLKRGFG